MRFDSPPWSRSSGACVALATVLALLGAACGGTSSTGGNAETVEIGLLVPLTGPNAEIGQMEKVGADIAVKEINESGGIKALGGAKLKLVVQDAGTQVSDAVNGMNSLLASHRIVAGMGPGISSPALAASEVSEQHRVPWVDLSFDDKLTQRGFHYLFITSPMQSSFDAVTYPAVEQLATQAGVNLKRIALLYSPNTTTTLGAMHIKDIYAKQFGWQVVLDKQIQQGAVTGGFLSTLVSSIRQAQPQVLFLGISTPDVVNIQREEIAEGMTPIPWVLNGAPYLTTGFRDALGASGTQGIITSASAGVYKSNQAVARKITATGQVAEEHDLATYSQVYMIVDAINNAKSTDHDKVRDALARLDLHGGPGAAAWPCNCIKFDSTGRASTASSILVQWQNGVPETVYPPNLATAKPYWPKL